MENKYPVVWTSETSVREMLCNQEKKIVDKYKKEKKKKDERKK